jgi:uncharacterized protein YdiU (UPF0061 family)
VLTRIAASHIRVGTFQFFAARGDTEGLRGLADHVIERPYPEVAGAERPYLALLERVIAAQADLIARWLLIGFIHGVMNTDNMSVSGETIDYGPCAFMDAFDPATVFSSIDERGRYAYGNQPKVLQWNLARLAEALLPLLDESSEAAVDAATEVLNGFAEAYERHWAAGMADKLGLAAPDRDLVDDILKLMRLQKVDFTQFFRALSAGTARTLFAEPEPFDDWAARREVLLAADRAAVAAAMDRVNPVYIPRNHRVEEALAQATDGEMGSFHRLVEVVSRPFEERPGLEDYAGPAPTGAPYVTYCGT